MLALARGTVAPVGLKIRTALQSWYPGQEAGDAMADVLTGTEPDGRLPQTFPARWAQLESHAGLDGRVRAVTRSV
jgi:beta-glucosidase